MYQFYIDNILYPVPPEKLQVKIANKNETITLINTGEVNRLKASGLTELSITDLLLPAVKYPFAEYGSAGFQRPSVYLGQLEQLKTGKKTFRVVLIRKLANRDLGWRTSMTCTLEDYTITEDAKEGVDVKVDMTFKQWRSYGTKKITFKKSKGKTIKQTTIGRSSKKRATQSYTVKKGDTLKGIAKKLLGSASYWKDIYKLNKKVIQKAAKKRGKPGNGSWLFAGTKLQIPLMMTAVKIESDSFNQLKDTTFSDFSRVPELFQQ